MGLLRRLAFVLRAWWTWHSAGGWSVEPFCFGCGRVFPEDAVIDRTGDLFLCVPCLVTGWHFDFMEPVPPRRPHSPSHAMITVHGLGEGEVIVLEGGHDWRPVVGTKLGGPR